MSNGQLNDIGTHAGSDAVTEGMKARLTLLLARRDEIDREIRVVREGIWERLRDRAEHRRTLDLRSHE